MSRAINLLPPSSPLHGFISRTLRRWWAVWAFTGVFYLALAWQLHRDEKSLAAEASNHRAWLDEASRLEKEVRAISLSRVSLRQQSSSPLALLHGFPTLPFLRVLVDSIEQASKAERFDANPKAQQTDTAGSETPLSRIVVESIDVQPKTPDRLDLFQVSLVATCPNAAAAQEFTKRITACDWIIETHRPVNLPHADRQGSCDLTLKFMVVAGQFGDQP